VLTGQAALVTGGARGIGRACAELLSAAGAAVVIVDRLAGDAEAAAQALRAAGGDAAAIEADLSELRNVAPMAETAARAFGRIDILVNNAGIISEVPTAELTEAQWDRVTGINLKAVVFVTQACLPGMVRRGSGAVVNISSLAARVGGIATGVDYTATKAAVIGVTRRLAREYGPKGIRVNAVAPGPIATEMTRHWSAELRESFVARIPLGRFGTAEDVARVVVFLAGPDAAYLTGVTIDVNGGGYMG
jgi:3-oxoacyl-[acyl-carrier protein] reductase